MNSALKLMKHLITAVAFTTSSLAVGDIIGPASDSIFLNLGESVTVSKTLVVESNAPTAAGPIVDLMFMFDVSGSMGDEIEAAKGLGDFVLGYMADRYDLRTGAGWYSDTPPAPGFDGVHIDLNNGNTSAASGIADMWDTSRCSVAGNFVGCGGDRFELGYDAIADAAANADWREGAERYIFALGDAGFKVGMDDNDSTAEVLAENDVSILGVTFASDFGASVQNLIDSSGTGGIVANTGTELIDFIRDSVLEKYSTVSVDDLGTGLPGIDVSVVCTGADLGTDGTGQCIGGQALGLYDRSKDRTFTYDVTYTALAAGDYDFSTYGLVDGEIVAAERDRIKVSAPGTLVLFATALAFMGARRKSFARCFRQSQPAIALPKPSTRTAAVLIR